MSTNNTFKDLKIVELASVLAGPSVGMFFAELGAEVLKFENIHTQGDVTRKWKTKTENESSISAYFASINYGKEHRLVDYKNNSDLQSVVKAITEADVVICNFKEGMAEKFGLDYPTLSKLNSELIYAQLDGFATQPNRVAFDVVLQAECGYMYMNGQKNSPPTKMPIAFMDVLAAHQMKEGLLVALIDRYKTGTGSLVKCSLEESAIASLVNQASNYLMTNHIPQRIGSLHPNICPYGEQFKTKDDAEIVLAIGSDKQFEKLCILLKCNFHESKKFKTNKSRVDNRVSLAENLTPLFRSWNSEDLLDACLKIQVPIGKVKNMKEVFDNYIAKSMILEEVIDGNKTKRVKSVAFSIESNK